MEDGAAEDREQSQIPTLRTPLQTLTGHSGVVISGDWVMSGDQVTHMSSILSDYTGSFIITVLK